MNRVRVCVSGSGKIMFSGILPTFIITSLQSCSASLSSESPGKGIGHDKT